MDGEVDEYTQLMEDGIGREAEDEVENAEETDGLDGSKPYRTPLPPWLQQAFEARLAESDNRGQDGLPPLYRDHKTFWFPRRSTFFLLNEAYPTPQSLYNPRFFLWDPQALAPHSVTCPTCKRVLVRHDSLKRPRKCIDQNSSFWIIGYRYRCTFCRNPLSNNPTVTFCSWDKRLLDRLPAALAEEFPAYLTHRSGISKSVFNVLRSCLQSGMGTKQFSNTLRISHLLSYDALRLQYLSAVLERKSISKFLNRSFQNFPPFDDTSKTGYSGFISSSQWSRDLYDTFIESHRAEINQHMSMLTANICAIDHSHKVSVEKSF